MAFKINNEIHQFRERAGGGDSETIFEIDNSEDTGEEVQIRFVDSSQDDPDGRFRFRLSGTSFYLERSKVANWADYETLLAFDGDNGGLSSLTLTEDGLDRLSDNLIHMINAGSPAGMKFAEAIFTALASLGAKI